MKCVRGEYVDSIEVNHPDGEQYTLDVWMNPESRELFAVSNMDMPCDKNSIADPYGKDVRIVFADTFSGLPK